MVTISPTTSKSKAKEEESILVAVKAGSIFMTERRAVD